MSGELSEKTVHVFTQEFFLDTFERDWHKYMRQRTLNPVNLEAIGKIAGRVAIMQEVLICLGLSGPMGIIKLAEMGIDR